MARHDPDFANLAYTIELGDYSSIDGCDEILGSIVATKITRELERE